MNNKNNSVLVTVLVIIIIVLLGAVYYFAEVKSPQMVASQQVPIQEQNQPILQSQSQPQIQTQSATSSNQIPTSPTPNTAGSYSGNNFAVEYPSSNVYEDDTTYMASLGAKAVNFYNGNPNSTTSDAEVNYVVYIRDGISDNQTLDTYTRTLIKHENGDQNFTINEKTVTVAGRTGIQFSYQAVAGGYDGTVYVTSVVHDNKAYIIQFVGSGQATPADYMNFVSSFSFQ